MLCRKVDRMSLPCISQSPTDPDFVQDPYPFYERARALGQLVYWQDYGMPAAVSYEAVSTVLRDRRFGREVPPELAPPVPNHQATFWSIESHSLLGAEPPRHTRLRSLVLRAFTTRRIAASAPEIAALCNQLIDAFPPGEFDLLSAYCTPIPVTMIARLLGVPEAMAPRLLTWSNAMVGMYQARRTLDMEIAAAQAAQDFSDFLRNYVARRRARPADDLITHLIAAEQDGARLSIDELVATCILLLNAGHEATVHALGNGVKTLCQHPESATNTAEDRIDETVEEVLRFDPPLHMFNRYAYENIELFGHFFKRGDQVSCLLAAANRDPAVFADPAVFDPTTRSKSQLAFGNGIHFCVGAPLARLELRIALQTLFARHPDLRVAQSPQYANLFHFRGLKSLIVRA